MPGKESGEVLTSIQTHLSDLTSRILLNGYGSRSMHYI